MDDSAVVLLTWELFSEVIHNKKTGHWHLKPEKVLDSKYVVLCQNRPKWKEKDECRYPHGAAFMIGKIKDVHRSRDQRYRDRYEIMFDEWAQICNHEKKWPGHRNPVWYTQLNEIGINLSELRFKA